MYLSVNISIFPKEAFICLLFVIITLLQIKYLKKKLVHNIIPLKLCYTEIATDIILNKHG